MRNFNTFCVVLLLSAYPPVDFTSFPWICPAWSSSHCPRAGEIPTDSLAVLCVLLTVGIGVNCVVLVTAGHC